MFPVLSFSVDSASTVQCSTDNALPGLDTLQENADKERFFAELEGSHNIQIDYSELNRQLENTEKSSTARYIELNAYECTML